MIGLRSMPLSIARRVRSGSPSIAALNALALATCGLIETPS
jgi:hypothetical protein